VSVRASATCTSAERTPHQLPRSIAMKTLVTSRIILLAAASVLSTACEKTEPVRTRDDIAADSALAADLALANRDTLLIDSMLIDSIGHRLSGGAPTARGAADTAASADAGQSRIAAAPKTVAPTPAPAPAPSASRPSPPPAPPVTAPVRTAPARAVAKSSARRVTGDPCGSPTLANQQRCVQARLAEADKRLNGVYRALLTEMRRQEGVRPGQKDPPSVERLRAAQRSWLAERDTECRRRGRGTEGALWAQTRVACLGEFSARRANELADNFSRLTAR
jgi:uncharacterized protein YecT (DUF1311 family)